MRRVNHGDAEAAARHLLALPAELRAMSMRRLIDRAIMADTFRRRFGRSHILWGDGTLAAAARQGRLAPEPFLDDAEYCGCLVLVFQTLLDKMPSIRAHQLHHIKPI